jgi:hypothetical protein
MGYAYCLGHCIACKKLITFNPVRVPSLRIKGSREPICAECFKRWNAIHRISKGLKALPLAPDAYSECDETELQY